MASTGGCLGRRVTASSRPPGIESSFEGASCTKWKEARFQRATSTTTNSNSWSSWGSCGRPGGTGTTAHPVEAVRAKALSLPEGELARASPENLYADRAAWMNDAHHGPGSRSPDCGDPEETRDRGTLSAAGGRDRPRASR